MSAPPSLAHLLYQDSNIEQPHLWHVLVYTYWWTSMSLAQILLNPRSSKNTQHADKLSKLLGLLVCRPSLPYGTLHVISCFHEAVQARNYWLTGRLAAHCGQAAVLKLTIEIHKHRAHPWPCFGASSAVHMRLVLLPTTVAQHLRRWPHRNVTARNYNADHKLQQRP